MYIICSINVNVSEKKLFIIQKSDVEMVSIGSIKSKPDDIHTLMSSPFEDNSQRFRELLRKHGVDAENDEKQTPLQYAMYNMDGEDTLKYIR